MHQKKAAPSGANGEGGFMFSNLAKLTQSIL